MIDLSQKDRIAVVRLLTDLQEFADERGRRQLLLLSGLEFAARQIDVSGAPLIAASSVVDALVRFGRPTPAAEALGQLLNLISSLVGGERQEQIADLLRRYAMMTPVARLPTPAAVADGMSASMLSEKIVGENTLRAISFLARGLRAARSVALVEVRDDAESWTGSGFMISRDLLITNAHVVASPEQAKATTAVFQFEEDVDGRMRSSVRVSAIQLAAVDKDLDYAVLRLDGMPGDQFGWLPLHLVDPTPGDRVNIIQHPGGQPKQIAFQHNLVEYVGGNVVQYVTSTLPGSSGSPVLDDAWRVVALHHAGGMVSEPSTGAHFYRNEGVRIGAIVGHFPSAVARALEVSEEA